VAQNRDTAEFDVAGVRTTITLADALSIETALIARIQEDKVEDGDALIRAARDNRPSIESGAVRIGTWILRPDRNRLRLVCRLVVGGPGPIYRADVTKQGQTWTVGPIESGMIHPRSR
jgi:hypothetical protein